MADNRIEKLIAEIARELLDEQHRVRPEDIVAQARERHPEIIREDAQRLIENAMRSAARRILKALTEDEDEPEQLYLEGLDLPSVIAVVGDEDTYYVDTREATWDELLAGEQARADNVAAAERKLKVYREAEEILRPYMATNPKLTVEKAYRRAKKDGRL